MTRISVIMCCCNSEQYIKETIESVLNQTFSDYEFIIWNDGSEDSTETIVKSYNDERIKYYYHENTGIGVARSLAATKAQGRYVAIIDSDDICLPDRLEKEFDFLDKHPKYALVSSQMIYINEIGEEIGYSYSVLCDYVIRRKMSENSVISHSGCMYRKSIYDKAGGYSGIVLGEDHVLFSRMMKYGKAYILPYPLVKYRIRSMSLMHSVRNNNYMPILGAFRRKMINDGVITNDDVVTYNRLYLLSKKALDNQDSSNSSREYKSVENSLLLKIKPLFGERNAKQMIVSAKNLLFVLYYFFRR